ncbi:transporter [Strigomonas culicis]|uniref:Transporter n=1 Tax=Strigomonas culicis TaxID=28005 RepID=S9W7H6_9TRYP|nr:transporter [Strigomonas culicis]|eukprot:EPY35166.1 transporter [Strigomonas culicis]
MVNYLQLGLITFVTVGKVLLCCIAGMVISKFFLERKKSEKGLSYISVQVFLPCLLFANLCQSVTWESVTLYYWAPVIALIPVCLGAIMSFLAKNLVPQQYRALLILGSSFQNGLTFPISLVVNLKGIEWFGAEEVVNAQSFLFLYNIICSIGLWAIGEPVIKYYKGKEVAEERRLAMARTLEERTTALGDASDRHLQDSFTYPYEAATCAPEADGAALKDIVGEVDAETIDSSLDGVDAAQGRPANKRTASTVEQMRWYKPAQEHDAPIRARVSSDGDGTGAAEVGRLQRWGKTVGGAFKSPPVYASLVALCISLTPPLRWLAESFCGQILVGGLSLVGGGAIPVQLLVLGLTVMSKRQVAPAPPPADAATAAAEDADGEVVVVKTKRTLLQKAQNSMPPQALFTFVAIVIRLLMVPSVCFIVIHLLNRAGLLPNDSSFLLSMLLETASPSAINSSLICAIHSFHTQEYTRMIFVMYMTAVVTTTIWLFFDILYVQSYYQ